MIAAKSNTHPGIISALIEAEGERDQQAENGKTAMAIDHTNLTAIGELRRSADNGSS